MTANYRQENEMLHARIEALVERIDELEIENKRKETRIKFKDCQISDLVDRMKEIEKLLAEEPKLSF